MTEPQTATEALAAMLRAEGSYFARYEAVAERLIHFMPDGWVLDRTQTMVDRLAARERLGRRDGEEERMTDLDTIRERHWQNPDGKCASGDHAYPSAWPCDTRVVLDALDDPYWAKVLSENEHLRADADREQHKDCTEDECLHIRDGFNVHACHVTTVLARAKEDERVAWETMNQYKATRADADRLAEELRLIASPDNVGAREALRLHVEP